MPGDERYAIWKAGDDVVIGEVLEDRRLALSVSTEQLRVFDPGGADKLGNRAVAAHQIADPPGTEVDRSGARLNRISDEHGVDDVALGPELEPIVADDQLSAEVAIDL
jgi:hypothetical protein